MSLENIKDPAEEEATREAWEAYEAFVASTDQKSLPYHYHIKSEVLRAFNPDYGEDRICQCGHTYHRHFDGYDDNRAIGCKYCECSTFVEDPTPEFDCLEVATHLENFINNDLGTSPYERVKRHILSCPRCTEALNVEDARRVHSLGLDCIEMGADPKKVWGWSGYEREKFLQKCPF